MYGGGGTPFAGQEQYATEEEMHQDHAYNNHQDNKERHAWTDVPCCIIFLAALVFWGISYAYGFGNGNPEKMFHGLQLNADGSTSVCGVDAGVEDKPMLYWCMKGAYGSAILDGNTEQAVAPVCVGKCPTDAGVVDAMGLPLLNAVPMECITMGYASADQNMGYQTINFLNKYCFPNVTSSPWLNGTMDNIVDGQAASSATAAMESLTSIVHAWPILLVCLFSAMVLGYLYLFLLKCLAEPLIWATMLACILGFFGLGIFLWTNADTIHESAQTTDVPQAVGQHTKVATQVLAVIFMLLGLVFTFLACCFCSSIRTAAKVVEVTCVAIWDMPIMLILPLLKALFKGVMWLVILYGLVLLWTTAEPKTLGDGISRRFEHSSTEMGFIWYYIFASLWILAFLDAFYQFLVAYMMGDYYYQPKDASGYKDIEQCHYLCEGIRYGFLEHGGSLAFGSLLVAIVQFIQKLLEWAEKKNQEAGGNRVISCILACLICCFKCCEEIIKQINKNAYIDIAITATDGFCAAARKALQVMLQEGAAMAILNGATFVFTLFGTVFITLGTMVLAYMLANQEAYNTYVGEGSENAISDKTSVLIVGGIIALAVACCFMYVFDMASDTLIYCVGYDKLRGVYPYTAPAELQELFDETEEDARRGGKGK